MKFDAIGDDDSMTQCNCLPQESATPAAAHPVGGVLSAIATAPSTPAGGWRRGETFSWFNEAKQQEYLNIMFSFDTIPSHTLF